MKRRLPALFLALSLLVFLLALGSGAARVYVSRDAAIHEARASFDALRRAAALELGPQTDGTDPEWRLALSERWQKDPSLLAVMLRDSAGIIQAIPASSPYIAGRIDDPARWSSVARFRYPPYSALRLQAVIGGNALTPIMLEALYAVLPSGLAWKALRDALLAIAVWVAGSALILAAIRPLEASVRAPQAAVLPEQDAFETEEASEDAPSFPWDMDEDERGVPPLAENSEPETGFESADPFVDAVFDSSDLPSIDFEADLAALEEPDESEFSIPDMPEENRLARPATNGMDDGAKKALLFGSPQGERPQGLFSPGSGLGWEAYLCERLDAELRRAAGFEQDLSLVLIDASLTEPGSPAYILLSRLVPEFFSFRDLAFEFGETGFAVILPNMDVDHGLRMAEEFHKKATNRLAQANESTAAHHVALGISARAGRLVDATRLVDEARAALDRARHDAASKTIAFKPDPDRYRDFIAGAC